MKTILMLAAAGTMLAGCSSVPRNSGTSYRCSGGTELNVHYLPNSAIVRVNGRQTLTLRATPANMGQIYENRTGARLHRTGNSVTWNTALRSAPESCSIVNTPL